MCTDYMPRSGFCALTYLQDLGYCHLLKVAQSVKKAALEGRALSWNPKKSSEPL